MIAKPADSSVELTPLIRDRWSPRSFDSTVELPIEDLTALVEAARWQASANNAQPWRFLVARRGEADFETISQSLAGFNQAWAPTASALIVTAYVTLDDTGRTRRTAAYDLGLSVANLVTEATARGWHCHQMTGFDAEKAAKDLELSEDLTVMSLIAVGRQAPVDGLNELLAAREAAPRTRLELSEIVLRGL